MSFNEEAKKQGRKPFVIVEIDLGYCANQFGQLPCTASANAGKECYNTYKTCIDSTNFAASIKTYRFSDIILPGKNHKALVESVNVAPTKITPEKGLGARANCSIVFNDALDNDTDIDPYVITREYNPLKQGTFWGRFFARNPYYYAREVRVKFGFLEADGGINAVETFTYLIDNFSFSNTTRQATLLGKDFLSLSDALNAKHPIPSKGKLASDISGTATTISLSSGYGAQYEDSGRVYIGSEIIEYTSKSGDTLTGLTRGAQGTISNSHRAGDTVQQVMFFDGLRPDEVLRHLLVDRAGLSEEVIPYTDWQTEATEWLGAFFLFANIVKPIEINKLISEICEQCGLDIWSDDRDSGKIKFKVDAPLLGSQLLNAVRLKDNDLVDGTLEVVDEAKLRVDTVFYHHTLLNPAEGVKKESNFAVTDTLIDIELSGDNAYKKNQIKEIHSRWVRSSTVASVVSNRKIARFGRIPKKISFQLEPSAPRLSVSEHFFLQTYEILDDDGSQALNLEFQVLSIDYDHKKTFYIVEALLFRFEYQRQAFVAPNGISDYELATESQRQQFAFAADSVTGKMPNGDEPYRVI